MDVMLTMKLFPWAWFLQTWRNFFAVYRQWYDFIKVYMYAERRMILMKLVYETLLRLENTGTFIIWCDYMYCVRHRMSFLRPDIIKQHKNSENSNSS